MKPKIYIFVSGMYGGDDYCMSAVAEDGECIAGHVSSSIEWGKRDMGLNGGTWKHDLYANKYPDGYELEWVDDWKKHPFLSAQAEKNRAANAARKDAEEKLTGEVK
jgi:hypothetical protein